MSNGRKRKLSFMPILCLFEMQTFVTQLVVHNISTDFELNRNGTFGTYSERTDWKNCSLGHGCVDIWYCKQTWQWSGKRQNKPIDCFPIRVKLHTHNTLYTIPFHRCEVHTTHNKFIGVLHFLWCSCKFNLFDLFLPDQIVYGVRVGRSCVVCVCVVWLISHCRSQKIVKMSNQNECTEPKSFFYMILPVLLCGLSIPLSLILWLGNLAFSFLTKNSLDTEGKHLNRACCFFRSRSKFSMTIKKYVDSVLVGIVVALRFIGRQICKTIRSR